MKRQLILLNGPRHSGKDTAAAFIWTHYDNALHFKMSRPLKAAIKAFFNLTDAQVAYLENKKTEPDALLFGRSYVDLQISLSEHWAKDTLGINVFGRLARQEIQPSPARILVCSDTGFAYETGPLLSLVGLDNTLLIRLHRTNKTFDSDSRSYIELPGVTTLDLYNNGEVTQFHEQLKQVINAWLARLDN